jgi:hypothetical protein
VNLILTVAEVTAPVFLLALIGWAWVKLGFEYRIQFVTRLAMTLSLPALIFVTLMQSEIPASALTAVSLAAAVAYAGVSLAMWIVVRTMRLDMRTFLAPLIFGNTGNLGLPLALFAFGDAGLSYALAVFAVMVVYSFTAGIWMVSGGGSLSRLLREPMVGATLLGALFLWQGWRTPAFLTNALELVGQLAIPLMLITLGVAVARFSPARMGRAAVLSAIKLLVCAGIAGAVAAWFALPLVPLAVLVIQLATPVAVTNYLLAEKYGADAESVAGLVVASTLLAVLALPALLAIVM